MSKTAEDELLDIIAEETVVRRDNIDRSMTLDELGMDSIAFASIGFAIEEKFGVTLDTDMLVDANTVGQFMDIVVPLIDAAGKKS